MQGKSCMRRLGCRRKEVSAAAASSSLVGRGGFSLAPKFLVVSGGFVWGMHHLEEAQVL